MKTTSNGPMIRSNGLARVWLSTIEKLGGLVTCILAGLCFCIALNLLADQVKVCVFDAGLMQEFTPLLGLLLVLAPILGI